MELQYWYKTEEKTEAFSEEKVWQEIFKLKKKKTPEPGGSNTEVIEQLANRIIPHLTSLCNQCLQQKLFQQLFTKAEVIIFRKGEDKYSTLPRTYRPIYLLNTLGKLLEKLCKRIGLYHNQYGLGVTSPQKMR